MKQSSTDIQYLIKFVSKKEHADILYHGDLFMHSAEYYHQFEEQGQGDKGEASIFPGVCMYRGGEYPIYCMTAINSDNISDGNILINKRIIKDFKCDDGFLVLIDFKSFLSRLKFLETNNNPYHHQPIVYGTPSFELSAKWLCENSLDNLFVKHPFFSYQQEYRIIVFEPLHPRIEKEIHDGISMDVAYYDTSRTYRIPKGLQDISKIYQINTLQVKNDYLYIPL